MKKELILALCFTVLMYANVATASEVTPDSAKVTAAKARVAELKKELEAAEAASDAEIKAQAAAEAKRVSEARAIVAASEKKIADSKAVDGPPKVAPVEVKPADGMFANLTLGLGVFTLNKREIVDATIENGIVRVKDTRAMRAGPWLQTTWVKDTGTGTWPFVKPGFFLGAEIFGGDKLVRSVGIGGLLQFRRLEGKNPVNLGIGVHWTSIQRLGSGLQEDEKVAPGIEAIRYRQETHPGIVVNVSFAL